MCCGIDIPYQGSPYEKEDRERFAAKGVYPRPLTDEEKALVPMAWPKFILPWEDRALMEMTWVCYHHFHDGCGGKVSVRGDEHHPCPCPCHYVKREAEQ